MPQLEIGDYAPQIAWLVFTFLVLVALMWRVALPQVARVLEERERRTSGNIEQAERLKAEAEAAEAAYKKALADARGEAQTLLAETKARLDAAAQRHKEEAERALGEKAEAATRRIQEARRAAMGNVAEIAAEVARAATGRLIGAEPDAALARAAVEAQIKRKD